MEPGFILGMPDDFWLIVLSFATPPEPSAVSWAREANWSLNVTLTTAAGCVASLDVSFCLKATSLLPCCPEPAVAAPEGVPDHRHSFLPDLPPSHQHHDPGLGLPLVHQLHNGLDATSHLLCCVPMVVGTHPDHHDLWTERQEAVVKGEA